MIDVLGLFEVNPIKAIAVCAMLLCVLLITYIVKRTLKSFDGYEKRIDLATTSIESHMVETGKTLKSHSVDLDKATRSINGDIVRIEKSVFSLKKDVLEKTSELKEFASKLERETRSLAHMFELNIDKFDQKLAHIVNLKKEIEMFSNKIIHIEENTGKLHTLLVNQDQKIKDFGRVLKKHDEDIKGIKKSE